MGLPGWSLGGFNRTINQGVQQEGLGWFTMGSLGGLLGGSLGGFNRGVNQEVQQEGFAGSRGHKGVYQEGH